MSLINITIITPSSHHTINNITTSRVQVSALFAAGWHFPLPMMLSNQLLAFSLNFIGFTVSECGSVCAASPKLRAQGGLCKFRSNSFQLMARSTFLFLLDEW